MGALIISKYTLYKYILPEGVRSCSSYKLPYTPFFTYTRHMDINARGIIYRMVYAYGDRPAGISTAGVCTEGV